MTVILSPESLRLHHWRSIYFGGSAAIDPACRARVEAGAETVAECLAGTTREAARALGLLAETGTIEVGKSADLALWNIEDPAELVYRIGFNPLHERIFRGQRIGQ